MNTFWNLPILRLTATDRCRAAAPWFRWARADDAASRLRRRANAIERRKLGAEHPLEQAAAAMLHLVLAPVRNTLALFQWGRALRARYAVPYHRQWFQLLACSVGLGLRPQVYYYLRLHRSRAWDEVIDPSELHHLQREISPGGHEPLEDKLQFAGRANQAGLPVVPLLAVWRNGREESSADAPSLCRSLFVKRARSYSSIGVMAFRYNPVTGAHHDDNRRYSLAELRELLRRESRDKVLLVQPRLCNHPDLSGFSPEALCNYRVITGRHPDGATELISAALRFPLHSRVTCGERDLTLCAAVDLATGRLHRAEAKEVALGPLARHPVTAQPIEGWPVPRWDDLRALAVRAHAAWAEFPFIGWDIADTSDGPVLLEGSPLWGGYLAQMSGSRPLGASAFPAIYSAHLKQRLLPEPAKA